MLTHILLSLTFFNYLTNAAFVFGPSPLGFNKGKSSMKVSGQSGVSAMQMTVTTDNTVLFIDRIEYNNLRSGDTPFWAAEMSIKDSSLRGLRLQTNSFCGGGSFTKDGTLVSIGGDISTGWGGTSGLQAIRTFKPCTNKKCQFAENATLLRKRWYPLTLRLQDGSIFVAGGVSDSTLMTPQNNYEYYPRKGNNVVNSAFLKDALKWNLFPHGHLLPSGDIFIAANRKAMIYSWKNNKETRLPDLKMQVNYPFGAASALLPLKSSNKYLATVVFCGGGNAPDNVYVSSQQPSFSQCARMDLSTSGVKKWAYEPAPDGRIMANFVLTPSGKLVWINGCGTGMAGYYDKPQSGTAYSSADHPRRTPYLYDPDQPAGKRWSSLGVTAKVERCYHSVASLLPDGRILTSGSNPNPFRRDETPYPTEYRNEYLSPAYLTQARPTFSGQPSKMTYKAKYTMKVTVPSGVKVSELIVSIHDLGFSTHAVDYSRRMVVLDAKLSGSTLSLTGPPSNTHYPPGPAWLFVSINGIPSLGRKIMVG